MAASSSNHPTYHKLKPGCICFLEYLAEIRAIIYKKYFEDNKKIVTPFLVEKGVMVMPCQSSDYVSRLLERKNKHGLAFENIAVNYTISLLLVNRAVYKEALPYIYQGKVFDYHDVPYTLRWMPTSLKTNIARLIIRHSQITRVLTGERPAFLPPLTDDPLQRTNETILAWQSVIQDYPRLRGLKLKVDHAARMRAICIHYVTNALFLSKDTRIIIEMDVIPSSTRRDHRLLRDISDQSMPFQFNTMTKTACLVPNVRHIVFKTRGNDAHRLALLSTNLGNPNCRLREIRAESLANSTTIYSIELEWRDKYLKKLASSEAGNADDLDDEVRELNTVRREEQAGLNPKPWRVLE